ncbi:MAG TPA: guanylate kinase [Abditibacteriaceae bacterium]|jgi:guanylate kinase
MSDEHSKRGLLLVLSGPSGVGKDTVWREAAPCLPSFQKALTCTTRSQRPGEENGVHYRFVSDAEFDRLIAQDELLEWALVNGNRYGVPASSVSTRLEQGDDVICIIEVQGALKIRAMFPDSLLVFLRPPVGQETQVLTSRIRQRGAEDEAQIAKRLETASWELTQTSLYDYEIVNDEVEDTARQLCDIITREKQRRSEL